MIQVKIFDDITTNNLEQCNSFLATLESICVISVDTHYNTTLRGIIYVVVYQTT